RRIEVVGQVRAALALEAEAEKSAVLAITDSDSQTYANQARAATAEVERGAAELGELLQRGGAPGEKELLAQFSKAFSELRKIDEELLELAVKHTNLKASALAFGPATEAIKGMDAALSRLVANNADASAATAKRVIVAAAGAQAAALRIEVLLPPH